MAVTYKKLFHLLIDRGIQAAGRSVTNCTGQYGRLRTNCVEVLTAGISSPMC